MEIERPERSVRIGHVPVIEKPAARSAVSIVSHPVEATAPFSDSACLKA